MKNAYTLDFHDFSIMNNRFDLIYRLKTHFPKLKVSMFTIPYDYRFETNSGARVFRDRYVDEIKKNKGWIEIIPHGFTHIPREFERCDKKTMEELLVGIDEVFAKDGLEYKKGFCAPYWLWNQDVVDVLNENGWWGAIDRNQPNMLKTKNTYTYTKSIHENLSVKCEGLVQLHGHIDGESDNDLEACFSNLMQLDPNADWLFVSETIKHAGD